MSSLGLADPKKLTIDKVSHIEITVNEFTAIFKGDDYSHKMIRILNEAARLQDFIAEQQEQRQHEERQRQKKKMEEVLSRLQERVQDAAAERRQKPAAQRAADAFISKLKAKAERASG